MDTVDVQAAGKCMIDTLTSFRRPILRWPCSDMSGLMEGGHTFTILHPVGRMAVLGESKNQVLFNHFENGATWWI